MTSTNYLKYLRMLDSELKSSRQIQMLRAASNAQKAVNTETKVQKGESK